MSTEQANGGLTRYPLGSLRELCAISFPLMITLISVSVMQFADRVFLARYSLDALNSSVNGWMLAMLFVLVGMSTAGISEVFVGQYNGAKQFHKIGPVIWQMIYFSLASALLYIPLALFAGDALMASVDFEGEGAAYFKYIMYFATCSALSVALSGFFIGRGKVKLVTISSICANLVNIALDPVFIFGMGSFPAMGAKGAALATGIAQVIHVLVLFSFFIRKKEREKFGVTHCHFNWPLMRRCFWIGIPRSIAHVLEVGAWTITMRFTYQAGRDYASVASVTQSFFLLTSFIAEAFAQGITVISANIIGSKCLKTVKKFWKSIIRLVIFLFLFQSLFYIVFVDQFLGLFLDESVMSAEYIQHLYPMLRTSAFIFWIFFLFDCFLWGTNGFLTASGDTRFVMFVSGICPWIFGLIPSYILLYVLEVSPPYVMVSSIIYAIVTLSFNGWRIRSGAWKKQHVID